MTITILPKDTSASDWGQVLGGALGKHLGETYRNKKLKKVLEEVAESNKELGSSQEVMENTYRRLAEHPEAQRDYMAMQQMQQRQLGDEEDRKIRREQISAGSGSGSGRGGAAQIDQWIDPFLPRDPINPDSYSPEGVKLLPKLRMMVEERMAGGMSGSQAAYESMEELQEEQGRLAPKESIPEGSRRLEKQPIERDFKEIDSEKRFSKGQKLEARFKVAQSSGIPKELINDVVEGKISLKDVDRIVKENKAIKELQSIYSPGIGDRSGGIPVPPQIAAKADNAFYALRKSGDLFSEKGVSALIKAGLPELLVRGILGITRKATENEMRQIQRRYDYNAESIAKALSDMGLEE